MTIPVKWFHSGMTGAPAPGSAVNTIISILDACLINGFNSNPVDALTYDSATGKCTLTINAGHGFVDDQVVLVSGAGQAEYNGDVRATVVDATNITYMPDTAPAVATATGTITAKVAPVGQWEKTFSATNKAAYHSADPLGTGNYLRVDDSLGTNGAQVTAYESMTDVDTGTNQWANGYWRKSDASNTMDEWALVGDSRALYLMIGGGAGTARAVLFFGDFESFVAGDGYNCAMTFDTAASGGVMNSIGCITNYAQNDGRALNRRLDGNATAVEFSVHGITQTEAYPNPANGGIVAVQPVLINETGSASWRGGFPGGYQLLNPVHMEQHAGVFCFQGVNHIAVSLEALR